jgi:hypothetical protein
MEFWQKSLALSQVQCQMPKKEPYKNDRFCLPQLMDNLQRVKGLHPLHETGCHPLSLCCKNRYIFGVTHDHIAGTDNMIFSLSTKFRLSNKWI